MRHPIPRALLLPRLLPRILPLALLAASGCAATPAAELAETSYHGTGRPCANSVLDNPLLAQRLMAATYADGPRHVEAPVLSCGPIFRAL